MLHSSQCHADQLVHAVVLDAHAVVLDELSMFCHSTMVSHGHYWSVVTMLLLSDFIMLLMICATQHTPMY